MFYRFYVDIIPKIKSLICIIFIIIGAPLGVISRKGGLGSSISISLLFFIIYWAFLIAGEELADRGLLNPPLSMWLPNIILGIIGVYLCYIVAMEKNIINIKKIRILKIK